MNQMQEIRVARIALGEARQQRPYDAFHSIEKHTALSGKKAHSGHGVTVKWNFNV